MTMRPPSLRHAQTVADRDRPRGGAYRSRARATCRQRCAIGSAAALGYEAQHCGRHSGVDVCPHQVGGHRSSGSARGYSGVQGPDAVNVCLSGDAAPRHAPGLVVVLRADRVAEAGRRRAPYRNLRAVVRTQVAALFALKACVGAGGALKPLHYGACVSRGIGAAGHVLLSALA